MRLVKIDVVSLQSLERRFHLPPDPCLAQPFALTGNFGTYLGRDHNFVALAAVLKPVANDRLALAALVTGHPCGVTVRGVNKIQSRIHKGIQYLERCGFVGGPAKHIAAQHQRRYFYSGFSQLALSHLVYLRS